MTAPGALRNDASFHYCPGCGHRYLHRILADCIDTLGIRERVIGIAPVGCAVFAYDYFNFDMMEAPHGRPPAVATGLKRARPGNIVLTYQGDGDLAAIGLSEIMHAAMRGENITVLFANNAAYGMTGGQMAPTTLRGQVTTTTPQGRQGPPMKVAETIASLEGPYFVARGSLDSRDNIQATRGLVLRALECQMDGRGFSFVEALAACPTVWHKGPLESSRWIRTEMSAAFPPGILLDRATGAGR